MFSNQTAGYLKMQKPTTKEVAGGWIPLKWLNLQQLAQHYETLLKHRSNWRIIMSKEQASVQPEKPQGGSALSIKWAENNTNVSISQLLQCVRWM